MSFDITYIFSATCCLQRKTYSEERSEQRKRGNEIYKLETETLQTRKKYLFLVSSVRSSNSHTDLLLIHHPTHPHFFRSHRSSTLDFHFLSHYSYIKAIMLYKGTTKQDSGILWNTLAYSGIPWHTLAYSGIL